MKTEPSRYDKQAADFLARHGLKFRATLSDTKAPQWGDDGKHGHHYRVTISASFNPNGAQGLQRTKGRKITFDFWGSIADMEKGKTEVSPYDVLACISGDAYTPETFEDFCSEFGYETDSIRALQTFRRCSVFAKRLRAFFTEAELEELPQIQ